MSRERRKELLAAYKERKSRPGVFAVRCTTTGQVWVSAAPNLDNRQNGIWAALRFGGFPNKALQAVWDAEGADAFSYEMLEVVDADDLSAWELASRLQARERHWREVLGAAKVTG